MDKLQTADNIIASEGVKSLNTKNTVTDMNTNANNNA